MAVLGLQIAMALIDVRLVSLVSPKISQDWAMFGLLDLSLISICLQPCSKKSRTSRHGCAALSNYQVLGYMLLFLLSGSPKIGSHSMDSCLVAPLVSIFRQ